MLYLFCVISSLLSHCNLFRALSCHSRRGNLSEFLLKFLFWRSCSFSSQRSLGWVGICGPVKSKVQVTSPTLCILSPKRVTTLSFVWSIKPNCWFLSFINEKKKKKTLLSFVQQNVSSAFTHQNYEEHWEAPGDKLQLYSLVTWSRATAGMISQMHVCVCVCILFYF